MSATRSHASSGPVPPGANLFLLTDLEEVPITHAGLADHFGTSPSELPRSAAGLLDFLRDLQARVFVPSDARLPEDCGRS